MGNIRLFGATSGFTELAPPAVAPDGVLSLPTGTGTVATEVFAAGAGGLVHINTTTFSAVSSVSINDVFTSTFENYLLKIIVTGSVENESLTTRFRIGGVDTSSATYIVQNLDANNTSVTALRGTQSSATISGVTSDHKSGIDVNLYSPQLAVVTAYSAFAAFSRVGGLIKLFAGTQTDTTQFDGITLFPVSGTMTGNIRVYGYKNS